MIQTTLLKINQLNFKLKKKIKILKKNKIKLSLRFKTINQIFKIKNKIKKLCIKLIN